MQKAENIASNQEQEAQTGQLNAIPEDSGQFSFASEGCIQQSYNTHDFNRVMFESPPSLMNSPRLDMFSNFRSHLSLLPSKCHGCSKDFGGVGGTTYPCQHRLCKECTSPIGEGNQCPLCTARPVMPVGTPQFPAQMFLSPMMTPKKLDESGLSGISPMSAYHQMNRLTSGLQNFSLSNDLHDSFNIWEHPKRDNRNSLVFESLNADDHPPVFSPTVSERFTFNTPRGEAVCAGCSNGFRATGWCMNCAEMLCNDCVAAHQRVRVTKDHHVVPWEHLAMLASPQKSDDLPTGSLSGGMTSDGSSSRPSSVCCIHDARVVAMCETCNGAALCHICIQQHSSHHLLPPMDVRGAAQLLLTDMKQREKTVGEAAESVRRMVERIEVGSQAVASELRSVIHLHMSALEERKRDLLQRLETVRTTKLNTLKGQNDQLHSTRGRMAQLIREAESADSLDRYYDALLQAYCQKVMLDPQETDLIKFIPPDNQLLTKIRSLGELESEACATTSTIVGERLRRSVRNRPSTLFVQLRDACGEVSHGNLGDIKAHITTPDGNVAECQIIEREPGTVAVNYLPAMDGLHSINVFVRGTLLSECPVSVEVRRGRNYADITAVGELFSFGKEGSGDGELCRPWGICIDVHGRVIVADRSNNRIQIFDRDGNFLIKFGQGGTRPGQFDRPAGITTNTMNNIIVADKDNHRVQVFDENGTFLFKFGDRGRPVGMFNYPWGVACNSLNHIAVSDTRNHRVQIFNAKGMFMRKCGFDTAYFYKHLDSPRGVSYLPDGQLLITDFNNHRLAVWSPRNGSDMKVYGTEGDLEGQFCRPQGITTDPEGHILICDSRNNRVQVFSGDDMRCVAVFGGTNSVSTGFQMPTELPIPTFQSAGPSSMSPFLTSPIGVHPAAPMQNRTLLDRPTDIAVSPDGRVYVVDFGNNCIRVF